VHELEPKLIITTMHGQQHIKTGHTCFYLLENEKLQGSNSWVTMLENTVKRMHKEVDHSASVSL